MWENRETKSRTAYKGPLTPTVLLASITQTSIGNSCGKTEKERERESLMYLRPRSSLPHRTHDISTILHVVWLHQISACTVSFVDRQLIFGRTSHLTQHPPALQTCAAARPRTRRPGTRREGQRHAGSGATPTETTSRLTRVGRRRRVSVVLSFSREVLQTSAKIESTS